MRETPTARIEVDEDGILVVRIRPGASQRAADARENLAAALAESDNVRRPILVDIVGALPLDAEARHIYSGQTLVTAFTALALLVEASPLGRMMGNVYFRIARPGIPLRLFVDETHATKWLRQYRT